MDKHKSIVANYERLIALHGVMTESEKKALAEWERKHVDGSGKYGTSDWPGWTVIAARHAH
jgi:hypothetical protein